MIKFKVLKKEAAMIRRIAARAVLAAKDAGFEYDMTTAEMDLTATHANGNKLKLTELLHTDDFNFAHDVFGIRRHLNRDTGKLEDCFLPRFTAYI